MDPKEEVVEREGIPTTLPAGEDKLYRKNPVPVNKTDKDFRINQDDLEGIL